jgi:hypothetical protein
MMLGCYPPCGLGQSGEVAQENTAASGKGFWDILSEQIAGWSKTGQNILTQQNIARGVLTQTSPGVFTYVQPAGSQVTLPVGTVGVSAQGSPGMGLVLLGGAALLLVFMLAKR